METQQIYHPAYVKNLFDSMSKTYGFANYVTSFGFTERWRKQCIAELNKLPKGAQGYDLMSGMGEAWASLIPRLDTTAQLIAIDISTEMNRKAAENRKRYAFPNIQLLPLNVLENDLPSHSADFIISTFGLKTFDNGQLRQLAAETNRLLKPTGTFSFVEISTPNGWLLKPLYMFYLKVVIPIIGKVFLGNAHDYRMLGQYCEKFGDSRKFHQFLLDEGLNAHFKKYFYGCATVVFGQKTG